MAEMNSVAFGYPFAGPHESQPPVGADAHMQRRVNLRGCFAAAAHALQLCGDNSGVVEHQHVARLQQRGQIAHGEIFKRFAGADFQQPCGVARLGRAQRNALFRKIEIEKIDTHQR